jgi:hypothetical protein
MRKKRDSVTLGQAINAMLNEANNFHPNIKLAHQIGTSLPFLDIFIENKDGILTTSVYHKEAAEPYILPFKSNHSVISLAILSKLLFFV